MSGEPALREFELETSYGTVMFSKLSERSGKYYVAYCNGSWSDATKELDAFKIEQVNIALLLCICKEEELKRIERHYYLEFLSDLLDGTLDTRAEVRARSQRLGRTVHEVYQLVVAHGSPSGSADALSDLVARFKRHANPFVRDVMCCVRDALIVLFCPVVSEEDRNAISQVCEIALASMGKGSVSFGVSQPYPLTTMDKALKEVSFACLVQSLVKRPVACRGFGCTRIGFVYDDGVRHSNHCDGGDFAGSCRMECDGVDVRGWLYRCRLYHLGGYVGHHAYRLHPIRAYRYRRHVRHASLLGERGRGMGGARFAASFLL